MKLSKPAPFDRPHFKCFCCGIWKCSEEATVFRNWKHSASFRVCRKCLLIKTTLKAATEIGDD